MLTILRATFQITNQQTQDTLFQHGFPTRTHLRGKLIVPYRIEDAAAEGWARRAHGGNIVGSAHPPRVDGEPLHQHISDSDSWRVQIAVVARSAAGSAQKVEQKMSGGRGLPCGADERQTARTEMLGCGCDDAGILAN